MIPKAPQTTHPCTPAPSSTFPSTLGLATSNAVFFQQGRQKQRSVLRSQESSAKVVCIRRQYNVRPSTWSAFQFVDSGAQFKRNTKGDAQHTIYSITDIKGLALHASNAFGVLQALQPSVKNTWMLSFPSLAPDRGGGCSGCSISSRLCGPQWTSQKTEKFLLNTQLMFLKKEKDNTTKVIVDDEWIRSLTEAQEITADIPEERVTNDQEGVDPTQKVRPIQMGRIPAEMRFEASLSTQPRINCSPHDSNAPTRGWRSGRCRSPRRFPPAHLR